MQEDFYWSVCLEENSIQAAIWSIRDNAANVTSFSNPSAWDDDESLVASADTCLSFCIQNLPENIAEPTKTVFGVPSSWVTDGQIDRIHLDKIRLICNKLSLTPTGFVVLPEAIAHFKKSEEKSPLSAILIGIYPTAIDVTLFRLGNLAGTVNVSRSLSIPDDVTEGLARFGEQEPLPSRFLLYDSKPEDLEDIKQELIKTDWDQISQVTKFLHAPQAEILTTDEKMAAVSLAGAAEMGNLSQVNYKAEEVEKGKEISESFEEESNIEGMVDPATLGFTTGLDIATNDTQPQNVNAPTSHNSTYNNSPVHNIEENIKVRIGFFEKFMEKLTRSKNFIFIPIALLMIFFVVFGALWFTVTKAQVTVILDAKKIEGHQKVNFDTKATSIDFSKNTIPAKVVTTSVTGDKTKTTTGTVTVGTPSKGSVTFYNVGGSTTIPAGTVLTGLSLDFSLDQDVQIASASGAASAATAKGNVTSQGVGGDYNLASGTFFSVDGFSSSLIQAKSDADLSGGTSQEIAAVSKEDIDSLTKDLMTQLTTTGEGNLKSQLTNGYLLVGNTLAATPTTTDADHKVGEAATTVKLSMTLKLTATSVVRDDMNKVAQNVFKSQVPSNYMMNDDGIDFVFDAKDTDFMINLVPKIDTNSLVNQIAGKNFDTAKMTLSKLPGFEDIQIKPVSTPLIPLFQILPHKADNISIIISSK